MHKFLLLYVWFVRILLFGFPDIPFIMRFRGCLYGFGMKSCGIDFQVSHDAIIKGIENIEIGSNVFIGNHTIIMGSGNIYIGDAVLFGPHVVIVSGNHSMEESSFRYGSSDKGEIIINNGSWIGANCTIIKGAVLPCLSVLGGNSFLSSVQISEKSLYGGVPAKLIKKL